MTQETTGIARCRVNLFNSNDCMHPRGGSELENFRSPAEIAALAVESGVAKAKLSIGKMLVLGFLAGAFIALGFLFDLRVTATIPKAWGDGFRFLIGGAVFPVGLMLVVIAGAELLTGNMMTLPIAFHARRVRLGAVIKNWIFVTIGNFFGSIFISYMAIEAHLLTTGDWKKWTIGVAVAKVSLPYWSTIISAIGCNWLVTLAVWLALGAKDVIGKIFGIWFPIFAFVAIGFQHVVANMFIIPTAIWLGGPITWGQAITELSGAFIGNAIGGWLFVASAYAYTYINKTASQSEGKTGTISST